MEFYSLLTLMFLCLNVLIACGLALFPLPTPSLVVSAAPTITMTPPKTLWGKWLPSRQKEQS